MRTIACSLLAVGLVAVQPAQSVTFVSGELRTTTWTAANGPYRVVDTLTVLANQSLTIEPGVDVLFYADVPMFVRGRIHAVGTQLDSIRFVASNRFLAGADTSWGGLRISGGDSSTMHFVRVSDVWAKMLRYNDENGGGIIVRGGGTRLGMARSVLSGNTSAGELDGMCVWQAGVGGGMRVQDSASVRLADCLFRGNRAMNASDYRVQYGMKPGCAYPYCDGPSPAVGGGLAVGPGGLAAAVGCSFVGNHAISGNYGAYQSYGGGIWAGGASVALVGCTFTGNSAEGGGGIAGSADVVDSKLTGNAAGRGGGGVYGYGGSTTLTNCFVAHNSA